MEAEKNNNNNNNNIDMANDTDTAGDPFFEADDIVISTSATDFLDTSIASTITDTAPLVVADGSSEVGSTKFKLRCDPPLQKNTRTNPVWKYSSTLTFCSIQTRDSIDVALFVNKMVWIRQSQLDLKLAQPH